MTTITDENIHYLVNMYANRPRRLPVDLQNIPIGEWDVGRVTNMEKMFFSTINFDQPLNEWNVSNVTNMKGMFEGCTRFNQPLNDWNVDNVTNMKDMFEGCTSFNQPLNDWNVDKVTNMEDMFFNCISFNQPLNDWNVSNVTNMHSMFAFSGFNQPLNNWNINNVTDMEDMFSECPIEEENKPTYKENIQDIQDVQDIQQELATLYQKLRGPSSDAEIAEQCRNETTCPISAISLKKLHKLKRLVKLDGRCYSFYAFTQNIPLDKEPFTRAPWSTDAKDKIKSIRKYKDALQKEYNELDEDEDEDEENVPASTGGRKKKNRRTKRNKNRSQRNNKRKTMYRRKNRKN